MADVVDPATRSRMMSGIQGKNTKPELIIRKGLHALGFRYRIHDKRLPGKPDLVFARYRAVIFVHGCFWHRHNCHLFRWPKTNRKFWTSKLNRNHDLDIEHQNRLRQNRWRILIVWECALRGSTARSLDKLLEEVAQWLRGDSSGDILEIG